MAWKRNNTGGANMSDLAVQNRESEQEVMPSFDFLLERETERNTLLAEHRAWLKEIKRERPLPQNTLPCGGIHPLLQPDPL